MHSPTAGRRRRSSRSAAAAVTAMSRWSAGRPGPDMTRSGYFSRRRRALAERVPDSPCVHLAGFFWFGGPPGESRPTSQPSANVTSDHNQPRPRRPPDGHVPATAVWSQPGNCGAINVTNRANQTSAGAEGSRPPGIATIGRGGEARTGLDSPSASRAVARADTTVATPSDRASAAGAPSGGATDPYATGGPRKQTSPALGEFFFFFFKKKKKNIIPAVPKAPRSRSKTRDSNPQHDPRTRHAA